MDELEIRLGESEIAEREAGIRIEWAQLFASMMGNPFAMAMAMRTGFLATILGRAGLSQDIMGFLPSAPTSGSLIPTPAEFGNMDEMDKMFLLMAYMAETGKTERDFFKEFNAQLPAEVRRGTTFRTLG